MKDIKGQDVDIGDYVIIMQGFLDRIYRIVPWEGEWKQEDDKVWVHLVVKRNQPKPHIERGWARTMHLLKIPEECVADKRKLDIYLKLGGITDD